MRMSPDALGDVLRKVRNDLRHMRKKTIVSARATIRRAVLPTRRIPLAAVDVALLRAW